MNQAEHGLEESRQIAGRTLAVRERLAESVHHRLRHLALRVAPEGSQRNRWVRRLVRALRLWRREGFGALLRRLVGKLVRQAAGNRPAAEVPIDAPALVEQGPLTTEVLAAPPLAPAPQRAGGFRVPSARKFRTVFIGSVTRDFQTLRYRAHHVIEALGQLDLEASFVPEEEMAERFSFILSHDLIVLVRLMHTEVVTRLVEAAREASLALIYDIDDYIFEPWVLPYVEGLRHNGLARAREAMEQWAKCLQQCDYFTGSTSHLVEKATSLGKKSFLLHNGLNAQQIELSRAALEQRAGGDGCLRIGYFSGSNSHQADFCVAYPALMAVLRENPHVRLRLVGDLHLEEFPGLADLAAQIERAPIRKWYELPGEIAGIDINLVPLALTPFNEGKSNLKYYEAGVLKVPSIASPTRLLRKSIRHGHNGLLAITFDEWYDCLTALVSDAALRQRLGENAQKHVLRTYAPAATAAEALEAYGQIIELQRRRLGVSKDALSIVFLVGSMATVKLHQAILRRHVRQLTTAGHVVTLFGFGEEGFDSAAGVQAALLDGYADSRFGVEIGRVIPCCDVLLAMDDRAREIGLANTKHAHRIVSLAVGEEAADKPDLVVIPAAEPNLEARLRQLVRGRPLISALTVAEPEASAA